MAKTNEFRLEPINIEEFQRISRLGPKEARITRTPFGMPKGHPKLVASTKVAWAGLKGDIDNPSYVEKLDKWKSEEKPVGVGTGLKRAVKISRECEGVKGTEIYKGVVMPSKAVCQIKKAGKVEKE